MFHACLASCADCLFQPFDRVSNCPRVRSQAVAEEDDGELPADPEPEPVDDRTVTIPYTVLKAFLVNHELLVADFDGNPEELAEVLSA